MVIDHIDRDKTNNKKENLRICTQQQNTFNCSISKNNKTGIVGVYFRNDTKIWDSKIMFNRKSINLGCYKNFDDAIKIRLLAELKYFGEEFAPQRHLFKEYGVTKDMKNIPQKSKVNRLILCSETGEIWESSNVAGKELGVDGSYLRRIAKNGGTFKGFHFKYV